ETLSSQPFFMDARYSSLNTLKTPHSTLPTQRSTRQYRRAATAITSPPTSSETAADGSGRPGTRMSPTESTGVPAVGPVDLVSRPAKSLTSKTLDVETAENPPIMAAPTIGAGPS